MARVHKHSLPRSSPPAGPRPRAPDRAKPPPMLASEPAESKRLGSRNQQSLNTGRDRCVGLQPAVLRGGPDCRIRRVIQKSTRLGTVRPSRPERWSVASRGEGAVGEPRRPVACSASSSRAPATVATNTPELELRRTMDISPTPTLSLPPTSSSRAGMIALRVKQRRVCGPARPCHRPGQSTTLTIVSTVVTSPSARAQWR
jgi:hypothetical protein